ncbi:MAG: acetate--CoA ligase family protein [Desulfobacterales bacterium]|nr:acetate--CoA ligase family protein [Desulfobacterales bacterium]
MKTTAKKIIQSALGKGQKALSEHESKQLLACYDIPVSAEILAPNAPKALEAAEAIGFPLAMKACSAQLLHKTESDAVALNITSLPEVQNTFERLMRIEPAPDGVLVQAMVPGKRELVVGLNRDPQFGPCVMLGLGGIFTEVLADTAFRAVPFDRVEALDMVAELRSLKLFGAFRGEPPVDLEKVADILLAVGKIALSHPEITEIDINPLIVDPDGLCVAVDALVVLNAGAELETCQVIPLSVQSTPSI